VEVQVSLQESGQVPHLFEAKDIRKIQKWPRSLDTIEQTQNAQWIASQRVGEVLSLTTQPISIGVRDTEAGIRK